MSKRKAFNFYSSYYEVYLGLNDKQKVQFMDAMLSVQFFRQNIKEIAFNDTLLTILWSSIKHSIEAQITGFAHKNSVTISTLVEGVGKGVVEGVGNPLGNKNKGKNKGKDKGQITPLRSVQESEFKNWFEELWKDYRLEIKQYRTQYGKKDKAFTLLKQTAERLFSTKLFDTYENMLEWFRVEYIDSKESGKYTPNMDKWSFDDIEDYLVELREEQDV